MTFFFLFLSLTLTTSVLAFEAPSVFPVSVRQALTEKAKQLNPSQQYTSSGWSNRAGTVLTPVHVSPGVYTVDRPFYWNKIDVGCRCTIVELPSSTGGKPDLFVHSPVGIDGPLMKALEELGQVKHVVSPNYEHLKFASQWFQTYSDANMWGCPGLAERMPEIKWTGEVPSGCRPKRWKGGEGTTQPAGQPFWDFDIIQPMHIDCEVNPFTGRAFFNEVIYYHAPTKTLIATDFFWNYPGADGVTNSQYGRDDTWELAPAANVPIGSRLWKIGMDKIYAPFFNNFMVTDQSEYKAMVDHILNKWDVETVVPAHGDILRGKDFVTKALKDFFDVK